MTTVVVRQSSVILTLAEVCDMLRVHRNTAKKIPPGELPFFRIGSRGDRRYVEADVLAYIARRTTA